MIYQLRTLYNTDSDLNSSSFVIAAKASTAYFANRQLPSKHIFSNSRSNLLKKNNITFKETKVKKNTI